MFSNRTFGFGQLWFKVNLISLSSENQSHFDLQQHFITYESFLNIYINWWAKRFSWQSFTASAALNDCGLHFLKRKSKIYSNQVCVEKSILIKIPLHLNWELVYAYGKWPMGCWNFLILENMKTFVIYKKELNQLVFKNCCLSVL